MSMSSGANKWASRAVVVLQLAAWSAVGIILLQKGVTSLQKTPEVRNATQVRRSFILVSSTGERYKLI